MQYTIAEHRHRFAVWTAARAVARAFAKTHDIEAAIAASDLREFSEAQLPSVDSDVSFKKAHDAICEQLLAYWTDHPPTGEPSFGRAAKVVSIYLKTVHGLGNNGDYCRWIYPPIDRQLLVAVRKLAKNGKSVPLVKWTEMRGEEHASLIAKLRALPEMRGAPLWTVERWWGNARVID